MRDQRSVMIGQDCAVIDQEIAQIGNLLEIARHIGHIAAEVHVVELNVDNMLNSIVIGVQRATAVTGVAASVIVARVATWLCNHAAAGKSRRCDQCCEEQSASFHGESPCGVVVVENRTILCPGFYAKKASL